MTAPASGSPSSACSVPSVAVDPGGGRRLVVQVALDPLGHPRGAQRGEAFVEQPAGLAELRVGAVAQRQHGIAHAVEARRIVGHQRGVEVDRALRRIALAPGAGDHQQVLRAGHLRRRGIRHVEHPCGEAQLAGRLARRIGQRLGVAGFGAEQDRERRPARRRRGGGRLRRVRRLIAGEKAAQPGPLLGVGAEMMLFSATICSAGKGAVSGSMAFSFASRRHARVLPGGEQRPQRDDGADHDQRRRMRGMVAAVRSASASVVTTTRWRGVVASVMKATGSVAVAARRAQARGDRADPAQRHVEHQHIGAARQRGPVEIAAVRRWRRGR